MQTYNEFLNQLSTTTINNRKLSYKIIRKGNRTIICDNFDTIIKIYKDIQNLMYNFDKNLNCNWGCYFKNKKFSDILCKDLDKLEYNCFRHNEKDYIFYIYDYYYDLQRLENFILYFMEYNIYSHMINKFIVIYAKMCNTIYLL